MKTISLTVALDQVRDDEDIQNLITAIQQMKGVANITRHEFAGQDHMNAWCAKQKWITDFTQKFIDIMLEERNK